MNRVHLSGHLGEDADVQQHGDLTVARLKLGTTSTFRDPQGQLRSRTDWHRVTLFDALARRVEDLREGDRLTVHGELRTYTFGNGDDRRVSVEVVASAVEVLPAGARQLRQDPLTAAARPLRFRHTPRPRLTGSRRRDRSGRIPDAAELLARLLRATLGPDAEGAEGV